LCLAYPAPCPASGYLQRVLAHLIRRSQQGILNANASPESPPVLKDLAQLDSRRGSPVAQSGNLQRLGLADRPDFSVIDLCYDGSFARSMPLGRLV